MSASQKITITEALAEVKLIEKKLISKGEVVSKNLVRFKHIPDPLGDSEKTIREELQSIKDLQNRQLKIRNAISDANLKVIVKIDENERCIADWLSWKREISSKQSNLLKTIRDTLKNAIESHQRSPQGYKDADGNNKLIELQCNFPYSGAIKACEVHQATLDKLDGLLSLKNAITLVEV